jgi:hypothetical protein
MKISLVKGGRWSRPPSKRLPAGDRPGARSVRRMRCHSSGTRLNLPLWQLCCIVLVIGYLVFCWTVYEPQIHRWWANLGREPINKRTIGPRLEQNRDPSEWR